MSRFSSAEILKIDLAVTGNAFLYLLMNRLKGTFFIKNNPSRKTISILCVVVLLQNREWIPRNALATICHWQTAKHVLIVSARGSQELTYVLTKYELHGAQS